MDSYVERDEVEVLRVQADMNGKGPAEAMQKLEAKLRSLKGRKFYGTFRLLDDGEEYFACVERIQGDDPASMGLDVGKIPGGLYARRKVSDWERVIAAGKLGDLFRDMVHAHSVDRSRPSIEYYRSMSELHLLVPVVSRSQSAPG
ncbi:MAG: GyrI-like domain-containing protein [Thermoplasmata archaeon]